MSQISPPVRILAVCAVALLAAWMLFLKPKPVTAPAAPPATATQAPAATAPATATTPANATAAAPANDAATATLPRPVRAAVREHKVMALLFWNPKAADDRAVQRELRDATAGREDVVVHAAPVSDISRYGAITRGVDVQQSPTVVVVDRTRNAEALVGYHEHAAFEQSIDDALRAGR